jgi:hypothetical protein
VGKTIINHPFGNSLYHLFMVIWGMVYYCFTHIKQRKVPQTTPKNPLHNRPLRSLQGLTPLDRLRVKRAWREMQRLPWIRQGRLPSAAAWRSGGGDGIWGKYGSRHGTESGGQEIMADIARTGSSHLLKSPPAKQLHQFSYNSSILPYTFSYTTYLYYEPITFYSSYFLSLIR